MASDLPPASPKSILRGHQAQVHALDFVRGNQRLASGDAEGYVVLWDLTIMRPRAVWRPHTNAILGIGSWGADRIITHGRDNQLIVWKISEDDEAHLSTVLPLTPTAESRPQPWIVHMLPVNTMNFCSFATCPESPNGSEDGLFIAVPNTLASESVDIYHLPSQNRLYTVHSAEKSDNGMAMALDLFYQNDALTLVTAHENGLATVVQQNTSGDWQLLYRAQCHTQPVLSLGVAPDLGYFLTSSADALIVKHPIPPRTAFSTPVPNSTFRQATDVSAGKEKSLLSKAFSEEPKSASPQRQPSSEVVTQPLRIVNTKHSGQQSLRIRPDGRIFATAGWDSKVRVYSSRTLKELAVLRWHQSGCYAVAFANPKDAESPREPQDAGLTTKGEEQGTMAVIPKLVDMTVKDRRIKHAKEAHWLAAGSKDGRISLWDIY